MNLVPIQVDSSLLVEVRTRGGKVGWLGERKKGMDGDTFAGLYFVGGQKQAEWDACVMRCNEIPMAFCLSFPFPSLLEVSIWTGVILGCGVYSTSPQHTEVSGSVPSVVYPGLEVLFIVTIPGKSHCIRYELDTWPKLIDFRQLHRNIFKHTSNTGPDMTGTNRSEAENRSRDRRTQIG